LAAAELRDWVKMEHQIFQRPYISIGGVGGSGTRLVAAVLINSGLNIGRDVNVSSDTLSFTLFFKERAILTAPKEEFERRLYVFLKYLNGHELSQSDIDIADALSKSDRGQHGVDWLAERVRQLAYPPTQPLENAALGWKEPNTHVVVERLLHTLPAMKYIHVVRHGIEMAYSGNQNQVQFWNGNNHARSPVTPEKSLDWWCSVHCRIRDLCKRYPERIYIVRFEDLLKAPSRTIEALLEFCEINVTSDDLANLTDLVHSDRTTPRDYKQVPVHVRSSQLEILHAFGYRINEGDDVTIVDWNV